MRIIARALVVAMVATIPLAACASDGGFRGDPGRRQDASSAACAEGGRYLRAHMEMLAGDALNGRRSGTRDEWVAAEYAASQLRQSGVVPAAGAATLVRPVDASGEAEDEPESTRTWNVVGALPGRDPALSADVVLVTAHLDHLGSRGDEGDVIFNGADDNASGVAAVLEIARRMAARGGGGRTVMFALFGGEERGGLGSRAFIRDPPVPLGRIVVNVNIEMIGRPDPLVPAGALWLTGYERSTLGNELGGRFAVVADPRPDEKFFLRSDNIRFARQGIVAHTLSTFGLHADYHSADDEVGRIDFAHMCRAVDVLTDAIGWLVRSSFVPRWLEGGRPS